MADYRYRVWKNSKGNASWQISIGELSSVEEADRKQKALGDIFRDADDPNFGWYGDYRDWWVDGGDFMGVVYVRPAQGWFGRRVLKRDDDHYLDASARARAVAEETIAKACKRLRQLEAAQIRKDEAGWEETGCA